MKLSDPHFLELYDNIFKPGTRIKIELQYVDILCPCNSMLLEKERDCRRLLILPFTTGRMNYTVLYCTILYF